MCAQGLCSATCRQRVANFRPAEAKHGQVLRGVILFMYTQLLVKHFENSVPNVIRLPVPRHLRSVLAAILILRNPNYPRHFLNGCYLILQDVDPPEANFSSSLEDSLLSSFRCSDKRWHQLQTWNTPLFSQHSPLTAAFKILGWPCEPNITGLLTEGPSLVMSMKPNFAQKTYAGLQCYITQLSSNSWIADGGEYFRAEYPAKSASVEHETTLVWVCAGTSKPVGYTQYIALENEKGESQILITGLAVEESHRRRGFGRGLILAVVCRMWHCTEIWIAVHEENHAAFSLYSKCGFLVRKRRWDLSMKVVISNTM